MRRAVYSFRGRMADLVWAGASRNHDHYTLRERHSDNRTEVTVTPGRNPMSAAMTVLRTWWAVDSKEATCE